MRGWLSLPPVLDGMVLDRGFGQGQCLGGVEEGLHLLEELRGRTKGGTRERERAGCGHGGLVGRTVAGTPYLAQAAPPSLASACRSAAIFPCDGSCRKGAAPFYFVPPPSLPSRAARGAPAVRPSSPTCASLTRPLSAFQRGDGPGHGDLRNGRRARPLRPARRLAPVERWRVGRGLFNDGRMFVSRQQNNTNKTMHNKQHTTDAGSRESAGRAPRARRRQHPAG
jgi:hypothetical protein